MGCAFHRCSRAPLFYQLCHPLSFPLPLLPSLPPSLPPSFPPSLPSSLDQLLSGSGGGVPMSQVTELGGPSPSGKTQVEEGGRGGEREGGR